MEITSTRETHSSNHRVVGGRGERDVEDLISSQSRSFCSWTLQGCTHPLGTRTPGALATSHVFIGLEYLRNGVDVGGPGCRYHGEVVVAIVEQTGQGSEVSELKHRIMEDQYVGTSEDRGEHLSRWYIPEFHWRRRPWIAS